MRPELIGWASAVILLATLSAQTWKLYRTRSNDGVSRWLYIGELAAAAGFATYSALLHNAVYLTTNALGVATSLFGLAFYWRNRRRATGDSAAAGGDRARGQDDVSVSRSGSPSPPMRRRYDV